MKLALSATPWLLLRGRGAADDVSVYLPNIGSR